jgi:peptide/nickel transport system substrate-binding protein
MENLLEQLRAEALAGFISRRELLKRAAALGLSAPTIAALLAACGGGNATPTAAPAAQATATPTKATSAASPTQQAAAGTTPTAGTGKRGGGGTLKLLWWQAPTILNPHLSQGTKDFDASNVVFEALAYVNEKDELEPRLATEIPSVDKGTLDPQGMWVVWKLRKGVKWHDGQPFTANDVKFTFEFASNKATAATTYSTYEPIDRVEVIDDYTVKVYFKQPTPGWFGPFVGGLGLIIPQHILKDYVGANARNAPFNLKPIGTGPYKVVQFNPGDVVVYEINQDYWQPGQPYFDRIELKGGGDATSAARAVLQTGEYDYAWNLQVEANVLKQLEQAG